MKTILAAVAVLIGGSALTPSATASRPGDAARRVLSLAEERAWAKQWALLHPLHQNLVSRSRYVACSSRSARVRFHNVVELQTRTHGFRVPATGVTLRTTAVAVRVRVTYRGETFPAQFSMDVAKACGLAMVPGSGRGSGIQARRLSERLVRHAATPFTEPSSARRAKWVTSRVLRFSLVRCASSWRSPMRRAETRVRGSFSRIRLAGSRRTRDHAAWPHRARGPSRRASARPPRRVTPSSW